MLKSNTLGSLNTERPAYINLINPDRDIRLFALGPGSANDELYGELLPFALTEVLQANNLTYEALSYAWGDPNDTVPIACRMRSTTTTSNVPITKNLHAALKRFRLPTEPRLLWIDALCINQLDIPERNSQIKHMAEIYSSAKRVLVWLGESHGDRDPFEAIDLYVHEMESRQFSNVWCAFRKPSEELMMEALPLFARPWFRRKWIIQEVVLAKEVLMQCGRFVCRFDWSQKFAWDNASYGAFRPLQTIYLNTPEFQKMIHSATGVMNMLLIDQLRHGQIERTLANLLMETRRFECTDPRDYVFSVLSIAKDVEVNGVQSLQADYSLSLEDVVSNTTKWMIEQYGLDILSQTTGDDWTSNFGQAAVRSTWSAGGLLQGVNKSRDDLINPFTTSLTHSILKNWGKSLPSRAEAIKFDGQSIIDTFAIKVDQVDFLELSSIESETEAWVGQPFSLSNYRAVESAYIKNRLKKWWMFTQPKPSNVKGAAAVQDPEKQKERFNEFGRLIFCGNLMDYDSLGSQTPDYGDLLSRYEVYLEHIIQNPAPPLWGAQLAEDQLMEELDRTAKNEFVIVGEAYLSSGPSLNQMNHYPHSSSQRVLIR